MQAITMSHMGILTSHTAILGGMAGIMGIIILETITQIQARTIAKREITLRVWPSRDQIEKRQTPLGQRSIIGMI